MHNVFVYGTLLSRYRDPHTGTVKSHPRHSYFEPYTFVTSWIDDFIMYWSAERGYPFLVPCEGSRVSGELYCGIGPDVLRTLDATEGVSSGLFERISVPVHIEGGLMDAYVYIGAQKLQYIDPETLYCCESLLVKDR